MAHVLTAISISPFSIWLNEVRDAIALRTERHRVFARTRDELNAMSDAELADIGLSRHMIIDIAHEAANAA